MVERRKNACFAREPSAQSVIGRELDGQLFDRDPALEPPMPFFLTLLGPAP